MLLFFNNTHIASDMYGVALNSDPKTGISNRSLSFRDGVCRELSWKKVDGNCGCLDASNI